MTRPPLDFDRPPPDPLAQLRAWLADAEDLGLENPAAMTCATVGPDGRPSARTVLLKGLDELGAVFFTNYRSRKGRAIEANGRAALLLYWDALSRQISIEGSVTKVSGATSDEYFASRPRGAQVGAWASEQSQPVASRAELEARVAEVEKRYKGRDLPRPPHWGGFRVALERIEFWQGHPDRVHDRVVYTRQPNGAWTTQRLCP